MFPNKLNHTSDWKMRTMEVLRDYKFKPTRSESIAHTPQTVEMLYIYILVDRVVWVSI